MKGLVIPVAQVSIQLVKKDALKNVMSAMNNIAGLTPLIHCAGCVIEVTVAA